MDELTSSTRASQQSTLPSLPAISSTDAATRTAHCEPSTSSASAQHVPARLAAPPPTFASTSRTSNAESNDTRMHGIAAAAKRAREQSSTLSGSATPEGPANVGWVHPTRLHLIGSNAGSPTDAARASDKEEADTSSGQDKRRRTATVPSSSTSSSSSSSSAAEARMALPTAEEFYRVVEELRASQREANALRARLVELERRIEAPHSTRPAVSGPEVLATASSGTAAAHIDMDTEAAHTGQPITHSGARSSSDKHFSPTQPSTTTATTTTATTAAAIGQKTAHVPLVAPRSQLSRQYSLLEPNAALLASLSLTPYSTTDLMMEIRLPPTTIRMARGHFVNHTTQPINHRIGIVNLLQNADGIQLNPPRVPLFAASAHGEHDSIAELQRSYALDSRECRYLDGILQAEANGDDYDPCQHTFTDAECVSTWHQLLSLDTRVVSSQHHRRLHIRLALLNPILTTAIRAAVAAHMQRVELSLEADKTRRLSPASRSGTSSPTPSTASTTSATSSEELPHPYTASMEEDTELQQGNRRSPASLSHAAKLCTVNVSPFRQRYAVCTVSNWPRAHPTELCGGNDRLLAFARQHAPDVRLVTKEENGMTSGSVTAYCQQRHLSQLAGLNGRVSEQHGIHFPLRLHSAVHVLGAKTCTFCWQPNHGAARCPSRVSSGNAAQPAAAHPACRQCYSFAHKTEACTSSAAKMCTLCKKEGHCTSQCSHFFPSRVPLQQYLTTTVTQPAQQRRTASSARGGVPAPILSTTLTTAARAWQPAQTATSTALPSLASRVLSPPPQPQPQQSPLPSGFVTLDQLAAALAPILWTLQQLHGNHSAPATTLQASSLGPVTHVNSTQSNPSSSPAAWQSLACTPTRINEQSVLAH
jgi:hypothetical protein